jgi:hypothetical protein
MLALLFTFAKLHDIHAILALEIRRRGLPGLAAPAREPSDHYDNLISSGGTMNEAVRGEISDRLRPVAPPRVMVES